MFLSFIVPVYNAENYICECLDSLLAQDISDYEILCVNDGSKDTSPQILDDYAAGHPNVTVIHKENGGVAAARNTGLAAAEGDYVWFVDSDDFVKENILGRLRCTAEGSVCDRVIIGCYIFDDALTEEEKRLSEEGKLPLNGPWYDSIVVRSLFRRQFLLEHNLSFRYPDITHGEDGLFMYEYVAEKPVSVEIQEAIYFYRIHSGSAETAVTLANLKKKLHSYTRITRILHDRYASGEQKNAYTANKIMLFLWFALHTVACMPLGESRKALKQLKKEGLYPFRRLPECNLQQSYMADTGSIVGKIYDKLYLNLHRPLGFAGMLLVQQLLRLKRSLKK